MTPVRDGDDGRRVPSMRHGRIVEDIPEIVDAAGALVRGEWEFDGCADRHWAKLIEWERSGLLS
jgi:hypothetical protein